MRTKRTKSHSVSEGGSFRVTKQDKSTQFFVQRGIDRRPGSKRFRNYCGLIKIARSGFPWEKTTKGSLAFPDFLRAALTEGNDVRLSSRKAACSSMAPPSSTGNPGSVYTNCETASVPLHLMQGRGRRPIGGLSFPVPKRMIPLKPPIKLSNINVTLTLRLILPRSGPCFEDRIANA